MDNDIALIKVNPAFQFNKHVARVPLLSSQDFDLSSGKLTFHTYAAPQRKLILQPII